MTADGRTNDARVRVQRRDSDDDAFDPELSRLIDGLVAAREVLADSKASIEVGIAGIEAVLETIEDRALRR